VTLPDGLDRWRHEAGGAEWLERLPGIVEECASAWRLEVGPAFEQAHVSFVAPAVRRDGCQAVLKINFPEPESEHEANALTSWDGDGAVRLLEHDPERRALLVERCDPGVQLWSLPEEEANRIAADVLGRLWCRSPDLHPFRLLADEAARWADEIPAKWQGFGRPVERQLIEEIVEFLSDVGPAQGEAVVLHQDFHGGNVLRSERGWLAIDPKPLVGEREFDLASLLRDRRDDLQRDPHPERRVRRRLDRLVCELGLDRERARGWGVAHALAWGFSSKGWMRDMVASARWLAAAR
jgi:streptomycin 6-kinase